MTGETKKPGGGRPSTALNQKQLARQRGLELSLDKGPASSLRQRLTLAEQFAKYIADGTIPDESETTPG